MAGVVVLDANVMIAALNPTDAHHASAVGVLADHLADAKLAHRLTVAETLVRAAEAGRTDEVEAALGQLGIVYDDEADDPSRLADLRVRTGLRMPDACVLLAALRVGADVATFDARLARAARDAGLGVLGT